MDLVEYNCAEQFMMASKARLFGDDTALSAILASNDPREHKYPWRQVRHFDPALWQDECEAIDLRGNLANFSQNEMMRVALENTGTRRIAEASPHDKVWGIGLIASDPCAASPTSWCSLNLLGQALECTQNSLRQNTPVATQPGILAPRDDGTGDRVFEVDPITHVRFNRSPLNTATHSAQLSAFTDLVPDDHAPEVLLAYAQRATAPLLPEQDPDLESGVVTMDDATFTTLLSLSSGAFATSPFNCRALLDTGSSQSFIHQGADTSYVRATTPKSWSGLG